MLCLLMHLSMSVRKESLHSSYMPLGTGGLVVVPARREKLQRLYIDCIQPRVILGDPGAVSRGRAKWRDESFQERVKEPLGTKSHRTISKRLCEYRLLIGQNNTRDFSAQSGASIRKAVWKWSGETWYPGVLPPILENFPRAILPAPN